MNYVIDQIITNLFLSYFIMRSITKILWCRIELIVQIVDYNYTRVESPINFSAIVEHLNEQTISHLMYECPIRKIQAFVE